MILISRHLIEENRVRTHFNAEYGQHLPEDLCLCIGNAPTRWEVVPWDGTTLETLPFIDADLITEVGIYLVYLIETSDWLIYFHRQRRVWAMEKDLSVQRVCKRYTGFLVYFSRVLDLMGFVFMVVFFGFDENF